MAGQRSGLPAPATPGEVPDLKLPAERVQPCGPGRQVTGSAAPDTCREDGDVLPPDPMRRSQKSWLLLLGSHAMRKSLWPGMPDSGKSRTPAQPWKSYF